MDIEKIIGCTIFSTLILVLFGGLAAIPCALAADWFVNGVSYIGSPVIGSLSGIAAFIISIGIFGTGLGMSISIWKE